MGPGRGSGRPTRVGREGGRARPAAPRVVRRPLARLAGLVALAGTLVVACGGGDDRDRSGTTLRRSDGTNPTITAPAATTTSVDGSSTAPTTGTTRAPGVEPTPTAPTTPTTPTVPIPVGPVDGIPPVPDAPATALLDDLRLAVVPPDLPDYRRKAFGDGWDYDGRTGCNVRELVLIEESRDAPVMGERCKPLAGTWVSPYDAVATTDPADLEIDHLVPLAEAWRTGATTWTDARREAFANDLDDPATLVAVSSRSNRSKGDSPPDRWLPPAPEARCAYVDDWIRVKARWDLAVSPPEKATLVQVLSGC